MHDSRCYRDRVAECLLAAEEARQLITANFISHVGACSHVVASGTVFNA